MKTRRQTAKTQLISSEHGENLITINGSPERFHPLNSRQRPKTTETTLHPKSSHGCRTVSTSKIPDQPVHQYEEEKRRLKYLDGRVVVGRHGQHLGFGARGAAYHGRHLRLAAAPRGPAPARPRQRLQTRRRGPESVGRRAAAQRPGCRRHQLRHLD
jgi:hypothetical protein